MRADVTAEAENGLSSLHIAADCGSVYALKELLKPEWGLDINRRAGFFQRSVLHQAAHRSKQTEYTLFMSCGLRLSLDRCYTSMGDLRPL